MPASFQLHGGHDLREISQTVVCRYGKLASNMSLVRAVGLKHSLVLERNIRAKPYTNMVEYDHRHVQISLLGNMAIERRRPSTSQKSHLALHPTAVCQLREGPKIVRFLQIYS